MSCSHAARQESGAGYLQRTRVVHAPGCHPGGRPSSPQRRTPHYPSAPGSGPMHSQPAPVPQSVKPGVGPAAYGHSAIWRVGGVPAPSSKRQLHPPLARPVPLACPSAPSSRVWVWWSRCGLTLFGSCGCNVATLQDELQACNWKKTRAPKGKTATGNLGSVALCSVQLQATPRDRRRSYNFST